MGEAGVAKCARGVYARFAATWRALALAACTLWANMLLMVEPLHAWSGGVALLSRALSVLTSIVGFVLVFAVARKRGKVGSNRVAQTCGAVLSAAGSAAHLFGAGLLPVWADVLAVGVYSVGFAFLLVGCGEIYAEMAPREALIYASVSYFLAWVGSSVAALVSPIASCVLAAAMPLAVAAMMPCWSRRASEVPVRGLRGSGGASTLADDVRLTCSALSPKMMAALAVMYFAMGSMMAESDGAVPYLSVPSITFAALTSLVCLAFGIALHDRVPLITFYKVLLVLQVVGIFLLNEFEGPAQLVAVVSMVGVCIVSWALLAQCAHAGSVGLAQGAVGVALPAFVYAAGHACSHLGEGLGSALTMAGILPSGVVSNVVVILLVVVAAFLFAGNPEGVGSFVAGKRAPAEGGEGSPGVDARSIAADTVSGDLPAGRLMPTGERIAQLAERYRLSQRETEVFALWATGHDLKYVQDKLGLSQSTVKTHVRHIYAKTDLHSRADIVMLLDGEGGQGEGD